MWKHSIGPLQPVIHVIQNRHAGKQRKQWGKTNKELILFKMVKKNKAPVYQFIVLALPTFTSWTLWSNWLIDDTWSSRESALFFLLHLSRACHALREMLRSPRLAHKEPVMKARVGSRLSRKRSLLLGLAVYGFGTKKLINQEIFGFISNTCFVLVLCLRCQRCQIGCHKQPVSLQSKPPSVRSFCSLTSLFFLSPSRILYSVWWRCYPASKTLLSI